MKDESLKELATHEKSIYKDKSKQAIILHF